MAGDRRHLLALALVVAAGALVPACLSLDEAESSTPTDGGSGTGGTGLGDSSWGGGAGSGGDASGSGGFTAAACDTCGDSGGCECVPEAPQGWSHARVADGSTKSCPAGTPIVVGSGAVDTGCGACQCGSATGGSCGFRLRHYSYAGCSSTYTWAVVYNDVGQCESGTTAGGPVMLDPYGYGGSCDTGTAAPKPATFAHTKTLCVEKSGGACGQGGACLPAKTAAFEDKACVVFDSQGVDVACPAGYPEKLSYSTGFDDTRKCACSCKPSLSCAGGSAVFDCAATSGNDSGKCVDAALAGDFKVTALPALQNADCSPETAATKSSGSVSASGLRVVCCRS